MCHYIIRVKVILTSRRPVGIKLETDGPVQSTDENRN